MTREEAIERMKIIKGDCYIIDNPKDKEAFDMSISALEQQPCDDAISLTKEAYSDLCLRASKADDLQRALDMEKGAYNALVKNIQCDDAVSREKVMDIISDYYNVHDTTAHEEEIMENMMERVEQLPSVTQKSGKWIDINGIYAECSYCNEEIYITGDFNYCPNCGAKMVEPQESEG